MTIIAWVGIGLIAAWAIGMVVRGGGFGVTGRSLVGVVGAMLGVLLAGVALGGEYLTDNSVTTLVAAFLGAVTLIAIVQLVPGRLRA